MNIISEYIQEQKRYSKEELKNIFKMNDEKFKTTINKLKSYKILQTVKATPEQKNLIDLIEDDFETTNIDFYGENYYVFTFVGILAINNIIIKCYPKYLLGKSKPLKEMKQIIKVLNKYNSKEQKINLFSGFDEEKNFNLLSIILYLINDYNENGPYINQQDIIETNGDGEILWDNTINNTIAIIIRNRPFYTELQTNNSINDDMNYFTRLHKAIVQECYDKLKLSDLLELFEMDYINLSEENIDDFGETDHILYMLERELSVQFTTRKQILLKTLYAYLSNRKSFKNDFGLSIYGTNSFNLIWEDVCSYVFNNKLHTPLCELKLPINLHKDYLDKKNNILLDIISKPIWRFFSYEGKNYEHVAKDTLIPDIVSFYKSENNNMYFVILDAKYYNLVLDEYKVQNYPGIQDVTKQYLYQLSYNKFIKKHNFVNIKNAFLIPIDDDSLNLNEKYEQGEVEIDIFDNLLDPPLVPISIIKLPANKIYNYYLNNKKINGFI